MSMKKIQKNKPLPHRPMLQFAVIFALVYAGLTAAVPSLEKPYQEMFIDIGNYIGKNFFNEVDNPKILLFFRQTPQKQELEMEAIIQNLKHETPQGVPTMYVHIDTYKTGLRFAIILAALVLASPVVWYRRLTALAGSMIFLHAFIWFKIFLSMLNSDNPKTAMVELTGFWKDAVQALDRVFMIETGFGASLAVVLLIWLLFTFKKSDFTAIIKSLGSRK